MSPGPLQVLTNRMFMVRGSRVMISFGFKVIFCIEKQFHMVLTWSDYSMDKCDIQIADEMDMTPLQVAIHEVSFYHRLKVVLLQLLSIHCGAVGMKDLVWFGMLYGGATQADVADRFGLHRHTPRSRWTCYQDTGLAYDRLRSGRPRVTSQRQDAYIRVVHFRNRYETAGATAQTIPRLHRISGRTVRNRWRAHNIRPCRPCVWPLLLPRHHRARLQWLQNHQRWRLAQWEAVRFTNESGFHLDGRGRGITSHGRTPLVTLEGNLNGQQYGDEVLVQHVLPFIRGQEHIITLQQDKARPQVAHVVLDFIRRQNIQVMEWPAMSPDMAPIEPVWDEMDHRLRRHRNPPRTLRELEEALREAWQDITRPSLQTWWRLMRRRCVPCVNARADALATDSANTVLSSPILWKHQRIRQCPDIFETYCVLDHWGHYCCVKISYALCRKLGRWWLIYECTVSFYH